MNLVWASAAEAPAMARAHATAFDEAWRADEFEALLEGAGVFGLLAVHPAPARDDAAAGVVLCRIAADEMEVLTLAVDPRVRRQGVGRALVTAALGAARQAGAAAAFLEVAVDNPAAAALYAGLGFRREGVRRGYYDRGADGMVDALVMRLDLKPEAP